MLKLGALQNCARSSRDSALRTNERPPCHLSRACGFSRGPLKRVLSRPQASFEPQQGFVHPPPWPSSRSLYEPKLDTGGNARCQCGPSVALAGVSPGRMYESASV